MTGIDLIAVGDVILDPDHHHRAFDRVRYVMRERSACSPNGCCRR